MNEYHVKAQRFCSRYGIKVSIAEHDNQTCPPWEDGKCIHGFKYRVRLRNRRGESWTFPFWGSLHMSQNGEEPTAYDVLSCIDPRGEQTADEVHAEFGDMRPSQAENVAKFNRRAAEFFTDDEADALAEVR